MMDILKWMIVMAMTVLFRNGINTEAIPYETQKGLIEEYVLEILEDGEYEVDPALILAIVEKESTYKWQSKNGPHVGLMQINPKWQQARMEKLGIKDLAANPYDNLRCGIDYISDLLNDYHDEYTALNVYNSGGTNGGIATSYSIAVMEKKYRIEKELWDKYEGW